MHAKVIIVDDKSAWVGSNNGSTKAMNFNREFGIKNLAVTSSSSDLAVSPVVPAGLHL
jgi:HKD family nuclease